MMLMAEEEPYFKPLHLGLRYDESCGPECGFRICRPQLGSLCEGFRVLGSLPVTSVDVSVVYMMHECSDWSEVSQQTLNPTPTTPPEPAVIAGFAVGQ